MAFNNEYQLYKDFKEAANDILIMANRCMVNNMVYLSKITESEQIILEVLESKKGCLITEGMAIPLESTLCNRIDFTTGAPLIYEDLSKTQGMDNLRNHLVNANVNSYLGVPIILRDGIVFGTLCSVNSVPTKINDEDALLFQKISRLFAYFLELERLAYRDSLTGLFNRQFLNNYFEQNSSQTGILMFLDLDGFKAVNDKHGHNVGDLVLVETAGRLRAFVDKYNGFAVRLGGDEFILYLIGITDEQEIIDSANEILQNMSSWDTFLKESNLSVSIGIVSSTSDSDNIGHLLKKADNALYRAKASGKNTYHF